MKPGPPRPPCQRPTHTPAFARPRSAGGWVKSAAGTLGVPVYSIRSGALEHVVKALRTLSGVDPSPGGLFARDAEAPAGGARQPFF